ncbi:MAG TPA: hypothetical protein VGP79_02870, partial [Bryobacteraceae bacterium]|nr:hypothetical protein [Bryobacteraceae bacterium]
MRYLRLLALAGATLLPALGQSDVGSGAPTPDIVQSFVYGFLRNGFNLLVSTPVADVSRFGPTGLRQEFLDAAKTTGVRYALILPNQNAFTTGANTVWQVHAPLYAYYLTVSQNTAGYPASDTAACPAIKAATNLGNTCQWQLFDKKYALFSYAQLKQLTTQNFATRDPFYTRWIALGGVSGLGPANTVEATLTRSFATAATGQTFDQGAIYNITSGTLTGRLVAVREPVYDVYAANGGPTGPLGLPVSD